MIIHANILDWAASYDGEPFHALLCDPPYHLTENHKRYSSPDAKPPGYGDDGSFRRLARGFMGKTWDGGDVAYRPETWAALAQHLYPGAFGMAFSGSRGWHRMAVAIEDAGLIIHPTIFCWSYGSGFPKATNITAQINEEAFRAWLDQHPAAKADIESLRRELREYKREHGHRNKARESDYAALVKRLKQESGLFQVIGTKKHQPKFAAAELGYREKDNGYNSKSRESFDVTAPATELAAAWAGHRYGLQSMKPAIEPIIVFQKPYAGRPVDSITATGAGALNVDGGRIAHDEPIRMLKAQETGHDVYRQAGRYQDVEELKAAGRWPANFVLVHHPACERVGVRRVKGSHSKPQDVGAGNGPPVSPQVYAPGVGGRITANYVEPDGRETIADWRCHPDCVVQRLGEQSGENDSRPVRPENIGISGSGERRGLFQNGSTVQTAHYDQGTAARFFHQSDWMAERLEEADAVGYFAKASRGEREAGLDPRQIALLNLAHGFDETTVDDGRAKSIDNPYQRGETTRRNTHPTIKPIALTRWLATLLLPPALYAPRRLLVPFAGAGSEMVGAMLAGWEDVTGIELEADHVAIAEARLAYWQQRRWELLDPSAPITARTDAAIDGQLDMFLETRDE